MLTVLVHTEQKGAPNKDAPFIKKKCFDSQAATGASTVIPMFLAVPSTIFMAASTFMQFRSGSLISAISCTFQPSNKPHIAHTGVVLQHYTILGIASMFTQCMSKHTEAGVHQRIALLYVAWLCMALHHVASKLIYSHYILLLLQRQKKQIIWPCNNQSIDRSTSIYSMSWGATGGQQIKMGSVNLYPLCTNAHANATV